MPTFDAILRQLRPGADYSNVDSTLENVRWSEGVVPPTQQEFDAAAAALASPGADATDTAYHALMLRRAAALEESPALVDKIEGLRIRLQLLGG